MFAEWLRQIIKTLLAVDLGLLSLGVRMFAEWFRHNINTLGMRYADKSLLDKSWKWKSTLRLFLLSNQMTKQLRGLASLNSAKRATVPWSLFSGDSQDEMQNVAQDLLQQIVKYRRSQHTWDELDVHFFLKTRQL